MEEGDVVEGMRQRREYVRRGRGGNANRGHGGKNSQKVTNGGHGGGGKILARIVEEREHRPADRSREVIIKEKGRLERNRSGRVMKGLGHETS